MQRRFPAFALASLLPLALFLAAREAASWRPQTISKEEFEKRLSPLASYELPLPVESNARAKQIACWAQIAFTKGWRLQAASADGTRLLVAKQSKSGRTNYAIGALLDAPSGQMMARLSPSPSASWSDSWAASQFSPRNGFVALWAEGDGLMRVYDAHTGRLRWKGERWWGENIVFSPDDRFVAIFDNPSTQHSLWVRDARTGRAFKRLPLKVPNGDLIRFGFSCDSAYLLAEVAPGQFKQLRLR